MPSWAPARGMRRKGSRQLWPSGQFAGVYAYRAKLLQTQKHVCPTFPEPDGEFLPEWGNYRRRKREGQAPKGELNHGGNLEQSLCNQLVTSGLHLECGRMAALP